MIFTQIKGYEMGTFNDPNFWTSGGGGIETERYLFLAIKRVVSSEPQSHHPMKLKTSNSIPYV
jgi:hypothetical protein